MVWSARYWSSFTSRNGSIGRGIQGRVTGYCTCKSKFVFIEVYTAQRGLVNYWTRDYKLIILSHIHTRFTRWDGPPQKPHHYILFTHSYLTVLKVLLSHRGYHTTLVKAYSGSLVDLYLIYNIHIVEHIHLIYFDFRIIMRISYKLDCSWIITIADLQFWDDTFAPV